jgi:2-hydroxy-3-keto-5-methylthiopentenyl-1-phosphate phosphatase
VHTIIKVVKKENYVPDIQKERVIIRKEEERERVLRVGEAVSDVSSVVS